MVTLREITAENFAACLALDPGLMAQGHVDAVDYSLAEAWSLRPYSHPKAIYDGEEVVGYVSLYYEGGHGQIINFLIDKVHQDNQKAKEFWKSLGFQEDNMEGVYLYMRYTA